MSDFRQAAPDAIQADLPAQVVADVVMSGMSDLELLDARRAQPEGVSILS